jgi:bis(5'-nucleosidyl)-tetraphosphatase
MRTEKEVSFYFATTPVKEIVLSNEHNEFKWVSYSDALFMLDHKQLKSILLKGHKKGLY